MKANEKHYVKQNYECVHENINIICIKYQDKNYGSSNGPKMVFFQ